MRYFFIFITFFLHNSFAKEYITQFGFKIDIPNNYIVISEDNLDETTDFVRDQGFNMSAWNNAISNLSSQKTITIYNINDIENNSEFLHNINFSSEPIPFEEIKSSDLDMYCPYYQNMLSDVSNKYVDQLSCNLTREPGLKGNSLYLEHYGIFPNALSIQYFFWIDNDNFVSSTLTCLKEKCFDDKKTFKKIISSLRRY